MLVKTNQILPHLIKQIGETAPTIEDDCFEVYDVPKDQLWKWTLNDGEVVQIHQIEKVCVPDEDTRYLYVLDEDGDENMSIDEDELVDIETFTIVPLILF